MAARAPIAGTAQGIVLTFPITLAVMGVVALIPVMPQMMAHFSRVPHYAYLLQGGVRTMPALCISLLSPLAGWMADRYRRRPLLIAALLAYAACGVLPLALDELPAIIASRIGVGACEAVITTVTTTMLCDYFAGDMRTRWLAAQTAVASLSALVFVVLGGILGQQLGWRGPFWIYLLSLPMLACVLRWTWEPARPMAAEIDGVTQAGGSGSLPMGRILGICLITLFAAVLFYAIPTVGSLALGERGVSNPQAIGLLTALANLGVPLGSAVFRRCSGWSVSRLLLVEFALIGAGFLGMGHSRGPGGFVLAAAVNQLGCGMVLPTLLLWISGGLAFQVRGRVTGLWTGTYFLGQFLSGLILTFMAGRFAGLSPVFSGLGCLAIFLSLAAIPISDLLHRRTSAWPWRVILRGTSRNRSHPGLP